jgi:hypothetical protein
MGGIKMKKIYEEEWYSNCCDAPPLYEVDVISYRLGFDAIGMCMCCRDNSVFELVNEVE